MSIVELRVATVLLPDYDAYLRPLIHGREAGRREDPHQPDLTIIDIDMDEAPDGAVTMDIALERELGKGVRIQSTTYYGADGKQLAAVKKYDNGGWLQPRWTQTTNTSGQPEAVRPAP